MNLYFISNGILTNEEKFFLSRKIILTEEDKVIRFNGAVTNSDLFEKRCDILYSRCDSNRCQGFEKRKHYHEILNLNNTDFYQVTKSIFKFKNELKNDNNGIILKGVINIYDDKYKIPGGEATTGFIGLLNTLSMYDYDNAYLINYDFYKSKIYQGKPNWECKSTGHNFSYEYDYVTNLIKNNENIKWLKKAESENWEKLI